MDETPTPRPSRRDTAGARRGRYAPDVVQPPGVVVTSLRRARYLPLSTDPAPVAALLAALYDGFLAADAGPDTWQRTAVLGRLVRGVRGEQWAVAELLGRGHLCPRELADQLASIAWEWYRTRPLDEDAGWPLPARRLTAVRLRRLRRHVHTVRDLLRDLSPQVAHHFDRWVQASLGRWTAEQAHEWAVRETVETANQGLGPEASVDEISRRLTALNPDLPLAHDASLFAADAIKGFSGIAMAQAGVVALSVLEVLLLGSHGQVVTQHGRPRLLDVERDLGRRLVDFIRERTEKPRWGHAAPLLIAACPSRTLVGWQKNALAAAVTAIPRHQRHTRLHWSSNDLPSDAHAVYRRTLGESLRASVQLGK
jgi:hypothetical protein